MVHPLWLICMGLAVLNFVVEQLTLRRLRKVDPDEWTDLGRPDAIFNNTVQTNWSALRHLFSANHKAVSDSQLTKYIWTGRTVLGSTLVSFVLLFVSGE